MNDSPLVSIICTAYNQEQYIAQALESFVMQRTSFPIEIIVHDDASNDRTVSIIREYETKYPALFNNIYQIENQYSKADNDIGNIVINAARGKYIALCEGDDYWIDPLKLQKQVSFLENNPDYGLTYSKAKIFSESNQKFNKHDFGKAVYSFDELLLGNYISTPTVIYRKEFYSSYSLEVEPKKRKWLMGDYPLWLWISANSKVKYFDESFSVYRYLDVSLSHSNDISKKLSFLDCFMEIKLFYMKKFRKEYLEKKIWGYYYTMKTNLYLFHNENQLYELSSEIAKGDIKSMKISLIQVALSNKIFRKILKLYWS